MTRTVSAFCAIAVLAFSLAGLAGCGEGDGDSTASTPAEQSTEATGGSEEEVSGGGGPAKVFRANTGSFKAVVFDESGYALYRFDKDKGSESTCYGGCAKQWPPLLTEGTPIAFAVIPQELGTTERRDGTTQVTYFGHPLYGFLGDRKHPTGQFHGHGVEAFGGTWLALNRNGEDLRH